jgi:anti-sigma B factor antagonist
MRSWVEHRDGVVVVRVDGDVDVASTLALRDTLGEAMGDGRTTVLLDLSGVEFLDSAGVGLLVSAHRRAQAASGVFMVAGITPTVARVLELTRTDRVLQVLPSIEEAIQGFAPPPAGQG